MMSKTFPRSKSALASFLAFLLQFVSKLFNFVTTTIFAPFKYRFKSQAIRHFEPVTIAFESGKPMKKYGNRGEIISKRKTKWKKKNGIISHMIIDWISVIIITLVGVLNHVACTIKFEYFVSEQTNL